MSLILVVLKAALLLLIPWVSVQATQCAPDSSLQLRFVAQLSVSGCVLTVHDTGASDGPHLAVEPIMCVTESLQNFAPRYDPVIQQMYVSVPVTLRDDTMLAEVQRQLRHLSPKSLKFATVSDISVSIDASSKFQALGFDWTPDEPTGILRLGLDWEETPDKYLVGKYLVYLLSKWHVLRVQLSRVLSHTLLSTAILSSNGTISQLNCRPVLRNEDSETIFFINSERYLRLPHCQKLQFIRSIRLSNCTARVHQRLDMKEHFLIEPLLCHNVTSMSNESVRYDYSRDKYYLKLDVVLQDDMTMDAVKTQLADFSPRSVAFMRLWRAQSHVAPALSRRFEIGLLMVSGDERLAQLRVYCRSWNFCSSLRQSILRDSLTFWRHLKWKVTSSVDVKCIASSHVMVRFGSLSPVEAKYENNSQFPLMKNILSIDWNNMSRTSQFLRHSRDRQFVVIQQQQTGRVSFQRRWAEYEAGFGDDTDFWIGLFTIHLLSKNGVTLRVEMKLWDGTELHAEYSGFKVGDASTNYRMTYQEMLRDRSNISYDAMQDHKGMQFSTMDRDNDGWNRGSCSNGWDKGGWWFKSCYYINPNGIYNPAGICRGNEDPSMSIWYNSNFGHTLREVRLMLQI